MPKSYNRPLAPALLTRGRPFQRPSAGPSIIGRLNTMTEVAMAVTNLLRVTKIRVEELFDRYTHEVPLRLNDRVTIIHGPNGVGKTVLLRLTAALLAGRITDFARI